MIARLLGKQPTQTRLCIGLLPSLRLLRRMRSYRFLCFEPSWFFCFVLPPLHVPWTFLSATPPFKTTTSRVLRCSLNLATLLFSKRLQHIKKPRSIKRCAISLTQAPNTPSHRRPSRKRMAAGSPCLTGSDPSLTGSKSFRKRRNRLSPGRCTRCWNEC